MAFSKTGGPLDNCKKGGARGNRLTRLTQYPPLGIALIGESESGIGVEAESLKL